MDTNAIMLAVVAAAGGFGAAWLARGSAKDKLNAERGLKDGEREDLDKAEFRKRISTLENERTVIAAAVQLSAEKLAGEVKAAAEAIAVKYDATTQQLNTANLELERQKGEIKALELRVHQLEADKAAANNAKGGEGPK